MKRWKGLVELAEDGLVAGATVLERAQKETAAVTFSVLERVPLLRGPARAVHSVHDATVSLSYAAVRLAGQAAARGAVLAIDGLDRRARPPSEGGEGRP